MTLDIMTYIASATFFLVATQIANSEDMTSTTTPFDPNIENTFVMNHYITCGDSYESGTIHLKVESCSGMIPSYFSPKTKVRHLIEGCAFHTFEPNGHVFVVKHVTPEGVDKEGRAMFVDHSRRGVLRTNGVFSPKGSWPMLTLRVVPDHCPAGRW